MIRWVVIAPDGSMTVREDEPTLEALQEAVQGDLEALPAPFGGVSVFVNEEKKNQTSGEPLPMNPKATAFMAGNLWPGTRLVGPMVVAGAPNPDDEAGMLTSLSDEQVASLTGKLG